MKTQKFLLIVALCLFIAMILSSCCEEEDPGPEQTESRDFAILDFDRLEMSDAFVVTVKQSEFYSTHAHGNRRNLNDLEVTKVGSTLKIGFNDSGNRDHVTYVDITLPELAGVNFSGAVNSTLSGFKDVSQFDVILSGASVSQLDIESGRVDANLSGASKLTMNGKVTTVIGKVSGASELYAFNLLTENAEMEASGASKIKIFASKTLK